MSDPTILSDDERVFHTEAERAARARVWTLQTRLCAAVARRDSKAIVDALMRDLAQATGCPLPPGYNGGGR